jgi:hypothetical protein
MPEKEANMAKRYAVLLINLGYWAEGDSIRDAVGHLPTTLRRDEYVAIVAVPADGVERLSVGEVGRVYVHGPNATEAADLLEEIYLGPWGQRGKTHLC